MRFSGLAYIVFVATYALQGRLLLLSANMTLTMFIRALRAYARAMFTVTATPTPPAARGGFLVAGVQEYLRQGHRFVQSKTHSLTHEVVDRMIRALWIQDLDVLGRVGGRIAHLSRKEKLIEATH